MNTTKGKPNHPRKKKEHVIIDKENKSANRGSSVLE